MNFRIKEESFGEFKQISIKSLLSGDVVCICNYGATVTKYKRLQNEKYCHILVPFNDAEQLKKGEAAVNRIMAPFSNRIKNNSYQWNGIQFDLDAESGYSHGLVHKMLFKIEQIEKTQTEVKVKFSTLLEPQMFKAYPFFLQVNVYYIFSHDSLTITIEGINKGDIPLPFGCGWHPYFYFPELGISHLRLHIPSNTVIQTDNNLIPLENKQTKLLLDKSNPFNFSSITEASLNEIGDKQINFCYADLLKSSDDRIHSSLIDSKAGVVYIIEQTYGVFYAYTPDELRGEKRKCIALEPVEFITDAFNRPELLEALTILPMNKKSFTFSLRRRNLN